MKKIKAVMDRDAQKWSEGSISNGLFYQQMVCFINKGEKAFMKKRDTF